MNVSYAQTSDFENVLLTERVKPVNELKYKYLVDLFARKGVNFPCDSIYFRVFKHSKAFEVWAFSRDSSKFILILHTKYVC